MKDHLTTVKMSQDMRDKLIRLTHLEGIRMNGRLTYSDIIRSALDAYYAERMRGDVLTAG